MARADPRYEQSAKRRSCVGPGDLSERSIRDLRWEQRMKRWAPADTNRNDKGTAILGTPCLRCPTVLRSRGIAVRER